MMKKIGDKTVGFIGINLDPAGIVTESNYTGLKYIDGVKAANEGGRPAQERRRRHGDCRDPYRL